MSTKISIIVPVYNVEKYLRECIDSVLAQTFTDFELLLIDDGSTDSSGVICDEYSHTDPRVKVHHKKNGGLSSARNAGIGLAKGKYIIFLDSDDFWTGDNSLKDLYALAEDNNVDVLRGEYISINEKYEKIKTIKREKEGLDNIILDSASFYINAIAGENFSVLFLFKKDAINELRFNEDLKIQEDIDFNIRFFSTQHRCLYTRTTFYVYRKRSNSITTLPKVYHLKDAFYICDIFEKYAYISSDPQIQKEYKKQSVLKYLRTLNSMVEAPYYNNFKEVSETIELNSIYYKTVKRLIKYRVINKKSMLILFPPLLYIKALHFKIYLYNMLYK